jgi:hypothetical protein
MILIIRGHIRNSFDNDRLLILIKLINILNSDIKIYIHTWNIFANNISWRKIIQNNNIVTKETIYNYFDEVKNLIEDIIIDDDTNIELIGNLQGCINNGPMPIIGWKNYWYGKYKIIKHLYDKKIDPNKMIINLRFDILNNSNDLSEIDILQFIKDNKENQIKKNIFIKDNEFFGLDNIYIGNLKTIYILNHYFHYFLDEILLKINNTPHQEFIVYRLNNILSNK